VDCREFDGQVVRLERIKETADKFVRVRLTRIETVDLNLFEFDYDLTFMVFFLNAEGKVYARYGGRDAESADNRQSLDGLQYTMKSVLRMHTQARKAFAPQSQDTPKFIREVSGNRRMGRCVHCHQVREILNADLKKKGKWNRDLVWRYPLPENLGLELEIDRGNVIKRVKEKSAASAAGLKAGDVVQRLNGVPIHSFGDAQYALDIAPKTGSIQIAWQRGDKAMKDKLALPEGWRKTDITWRPSMQRLLPAARLYGTDLTPAEKKSLGLPAKQLAFRQKDVVPAQAKAAGIRPGDIILGIDDKRLEMDADGFLGYVQRNYLAGDRVTVNILRDGKRKNLTMTLLADRGRRSFR
jgi:predicted metalloprotease with PDZ domain